MNSSIEVLIIGAVLPACKEEILPDFLPALPQGASVYSAVALKERRALTTLCTTFNLTYQISKEDCKRQWPFKDI